MTEACAATRIVTAVMAHYDLVIRNATIVDGSGAPRFQDDVAIQNGRIQKIGPVGNADSGRVIDASGKILAPGFIDAHTHDDRLMLSAPEMAPKVSQGVTTVVAGNCGISLAPAPRGMKTVTPPLDLIADDGSWFRFPTFRHYVEELRNKPAATNCALLLGHTMLRVQTMDDLDKPASKNEIATMQKLVDEALEAGAIGVSTGLFYEPARAATTEEVIEVCRPLSARNALYCTHMRSEADGVVDSLDETFRIGRELAIPVVVSHHKVLGTPNYGRSVETLSIIEKAMQSQEIGLDC
ncbi:MAG TPA: amidohydrolase family protein [Thermoanaerobaculia bacterium]|nr:amidohydrolase family protein [Thermoanaerobaculia bacterium]